MYSIAAGNLAPSTIEKKRLLDKRNPFVAKFVEEAGIGELIFLAVSAVRRVMESFQTLTKGDKCNFTSEAQNPVLFSGTVGSSVLKESP